MQTQRDHVHAHQFLMARMSSGLILGDPSMAENPMRRGVFGMIVGTILALLAMIAFGVYGWIVPGGKTSWRSPGTIIVEKESGTRYVLLAGTLHPTLNLTSAMIISGPRSKIELVSRNSLKDTPRGAPIGIPGAPQVLPVQSSDVVPGPWLVCLGGSLTAAAGQRLGLNLDPRAPATDLPADRYMLVASDGRSYLIWRGRKHLIAAVVPVALGVTNAVPVVAPQRWLAGLPDGGALDVPKIPDAGRPGPRVDGRPAKVGQLFRQNAQGGEEQLFVLRSDGLAPVNRTMFQMIQAGYGLRPVELDAAAVASVARSADRSLSDTFTDLAGARWEEGRDRVLCQRQAPTGPQTFSAVPVLVAPQHSGFGPGRGESIIMRPGTAMVVYPVPMTTQQPDPYFLTDEGRYRLPDSKAMEALNLSTTVMVPFPRALLETAPAGPDLTRAAIVAEQKG